MTEEKNLKEEKELEIEEKECHCSEQCSDQEEGGCSCKEKHQDKKHKKNKLQEEIQKLEEENQKLIESNNELTEKIKYSQAELINYRRRKDEETENLLKYANKDIILELLPIVDNFERAISLDDNDLTDELSKFLSGFKMMYSQMNDVFKKFGVSEINRVGEEFDPTLEQALMTDNLKDKKEEEVTEVLLKGYKLKDRVIRPATVKINKIEN